MLEIRVFMSIFFSKNLRFIIYSVSVYIILLKEYFQSHVKALKHHWEQLTLYTCVCVCVDQLNHLVLFHTHLQSSSMIPSRISTTCNFINHKECFSNIERRVVE